MIKHPLATLDYGMDWSPWLEGFDVIADSVWIVPSGLGIDPDQPPTHNGMITKVWITGGLPGRQYVITNKITTVNGLTDARDLDIYVPATL